MKIQVGTKVKFLNDTGGGIVRGFSENELVLVETHDGFEIPVPISDLIVDEATAYGFDGEEIVPQPSSKAQEDLPEEVQVSFEEKKYSTRKGEVLLALVPVNFQLLHISNFRLYLINDSNYYFHYVLSFRDSGVFSLLSSGTSEPDSKVEIEIFSQSMMAKIKEFRLQGVFFKHGLLDPVTPVDLLLGIENISFYKVHHFKENEYFQEHALILKGNENSDPMGSVKQMKEDDIRKINAAKDENSQKKQNRPQRNKDTEEIDLHIEEIVDNHSELTNGEIITIQISRFETALETAIRSQVRKIVFIHGVGNGRLKQEILKKLDRNFPDLPYQDASFKEYGFGATMVYLR